MAEQYIFTIESLSKAYGKTRGPQEHLAGVLSRAPRSASSAATAPARARCCASWPWQDKDFLGTARLARRHHRRLRAAGAAARRRPRRARQRRGGRRRHARPAARSTRRSANKMADAATRTRWRSSCDEMGTVQEPDRRRQRLGPRPPARDRHGRHAAAARRRQGRARSPAASGAASPCARSCCRSPTCCCSTSRPTTSTPSRSPGSNGTCRSTPAPSSPVTHDRYFLDNVAQWILELDRGRGHPVEGQLLRLAGAEEGSGWPRRRRQESARQKALRPRAGMGAHGAAGPRRQEQGPPQRLREAGRPGSTRSARTSWCMQIPPGPHLGDLVVRAEGVRKGYGDNLLMEDLNFDLPRGGIVGVIGPNGAGKTTLFRMIVGQEKPDAGKLRVGDTVRAGLRRSEPRRARRHQDGLRGDHRRRRVPDARQAQGRVARLRRPVQLQGPRPAAQGRRAVRRRTQPRPPGQAARAAAATCCCSTSRPTTSTSTRCGPWRRRCSTSAAAPWSSATTAGSSTASPRTSWRSRATARRSGARATTRSTRSSAAQRLGRSRGPAAPDQVPEAASVRP